MTSVESSSASSTYRGLPTSSRLVWLLPPLEAGDNKQTNKHDDDNNNNDNNNNNKLVVPFPMELVGVKGKVSSSKLSSNRLMEVGRGGSGEGFILGEKGGKGPIGVNSWYVGELRHLVL